MQTEKRLISTQPIGTGSCILLRQHKSRTHLVTPHKGLYKSGYPPSGTAQEVPDGDFLQQIAECTKTLVKVLSKCPLLFFDRCGMITVSKGSSSPVRRGAHRQDGVYHARDARRSPAGILTRLLPGGRSLVFSYPGAREPSPLTDRGSKRTYL